MKITAASGKKARHRWRLDVSEIPFYVDWNGGKGTVLWQKRDDLLLVAGAKMREDPPLNKDGSLGFSAKMGQRIRQDYEGQYRDFVTTEDILLKSVNEVGLFLYFGGTNSWLRLVDKNGKSIDAWTRIE